MVQVAIFIYLFSFFVLSRGEETEQRKILKRILFDIDYDINDWPNAAHGNRTDVYVQLFINSFGSLNAANMDYHLDCFLRQRWKDPRLAYPDSKPSITIQDEAIRNQVWKPDTFFENVKEAHIHTVTMPNILFKVEPTGDVLYSMRINLDVACNLNLQKYPLDTQTCHLSLASYIPQTKMQLLSNYRKYWEYIGHISPLEQVKRFCRVIGNTFACPPSSAGIERLFSSAGLIHTRLRNRLGNERVQNS